MADSLYRNYNLEKVQNSDGITTSGVFKFWADTPNSPYDVGDTFQPIPGGAILTVNKVSINDNVIGERNGKVLRQWQITVEGSTDVQNIAQDTQIKYNFEIDTDDNDNIYHSGTMEVVNTGDNPVFSINIGNSFNVPGIGLIKCTKVKGNDSYDNKGTHTWSVVYEGTDKPEEKDNVDTSTKTKYNFSAEKNSKGNIVHSGSKQVVNNGDNPSIIVPVGASFNIPGAGNITCTRFSGNDEYTSDGKRRWIVTYEGSDEKNSENDSENDSSETETKYNFSITKNSNGNIVHSGTMQEISKSSSTNIAIGNSFTVPGVGNVTCTKISGGDEYDSDGIRRWIITYEGSDEKSNENGSSETKTKYSFSITKDSNGNIIHSGSKQEIMDSPPSENEIDTVNIEGVGSLPCVKVSANDEYNSDGERCWVVTYECSDENENSEVYSVIIEKDTNGIITYLGSKEVSSKNSNNTSTVNIGNGFTIPGFGNFTCTKIRYNGNTITYEGTRTENNGSNNLPSDEETISYEINGVTSRTVSGELIVLKRSENPTMKKNLTVYSYNNSPLSSPGGSYGGGIAISENISKEVITVNNGDIKTYYRHEIEVEA